MNCESDWSMQRRAHDRGRSLTASIGRVYYRPRRGIAHRRRSLISKIALLLLLGGLLLDRIACTQWLDVAYFTDVTRNVVYVSVCLCLSLLSTLVNCEKTAEPIEMLFGRLTQVGLFVHTSNAWLLRHTRNHALGEWTKKKYFIGRSNSIKQHQKVIMYY